MRVVLSDGTVRDAPLAGGPFEAMQLCLSEWKNDVAKFEATREDLIEMERVASLGRNVLTPGRYLGPEWSDGRDAEYMAIPIFVAEG